jgi:hypothetical protein
MVRSNLPTTPYSLELILICIEKPLVLVGLNLFVSLLLNLLLCKGLLGFILLVFPLALLLLVGVPLFFLIFFSYLDERNFATKDWSDYIEDKKNLLSAYKGQKVPIQTV